MASSPDTLIAAVAREAQWLPHRYDPGEDAIHFRRTPRAEHRAATFLTDDYLPAGDAPMVLRRTDVMATATRPAPLHFIFHSAFCCSTLLARAFDIEGKAMGLKEPYILNDLVGWAHRGAQPAPAAQVLDDALTLLARPFGNGETLVMKPSNVANAFAPAMLTMRPQANALLLYAPLRDYLNSIARKGMDGRLWVRDLLVKLLKDRLIDLGFDGEAYLRHTDLQAAAVGWLAQHALFGRLVARFGPDRVRTLSSEQVTARPRETMAALSALFGVALDEAALDAVVAGPAFTRHSKSEAAFGGDDRAAEQREADTRFGDEIEKVAAWAEAVAANAGVAIDPGAPLLG
ncbi:hypothetical protein ACFOMD_06660 [Sphingoaurantiacus capsulatus]|uniref:Uncharacterized protein n=1 Tax=Sphingoaurantiacus capsulatus TaxID=1771310 RepID=A0ABV7XAH2_9SPHN